MIGRADKELFKRLDRDKDGRVEASDLKEYLRKKNLPQDYAHEFINRARGARWWSSSITCAPLSEAAPISEAAEATRCRSGVTPLDHATAARPF